jgi:membrane protein
MQVHAKQHFAHKNVTQYFGAAGQILGLAMQRATQAKAVQLAASLTFTTVLSVVPLLAVVLSLFTAFPLFTEFSDALQTFMSTNLMPPTVSDTIMTYLNEFAAQATRLTAIGGGFLVLTVVFLITSVESAFNTIWRVDRQRRMTHRILVYWAILTLGPVLTGASLYATAFLARESLGLLANTPIFLAIALKLLPGLLGALAFAALFIVVPNTRVNRRDAMVGGVISALILETMKIGFGYYVASFSTYTMIYGAFAALPVFLIWVYLCWLGILIGALVAANLPLLRLGRLDPDVRPGAALMDALSILKVLSEARGNIPPGCSHTELIKRLRLPLNILEQRLECLTTMGLVAVAPGEKNARWLLACDPERTTLGPLVDQLVLDRSSIKLSEQPFLALALSQLIAQQVDSNLAEVLAHHDSTLTHPLQSVIVSSDAGDRHA